jgi:hypothetical protein
MPFPDRDRVLFPRFSEPNLQDSGNVKIPAGGNLGFITGVFDRETKEDSGRLFGGCCSDCCGIVCEVDMGDITWELNYVQPTRPDWHPNGGDDTEVSLTETYSFTPWAALDGDMANLSSGSYTGVQLSDAGGSPCYCSRFLVFAPITQPQETISVTLFNGGDPDDLNSYSTGEVIFQIGPAMAYDQSYSDKRDTLVYDTVAWNIGGTLYDLSTDWGVYGRGISTGAGIVGTFPDSNLSRCSFVPFEPFKSDSDSGDGDETLTVSGPVRVRSCSSTSLNQLERQEAGLPKFPRTVADPNIGTLPLAGSYNPA